MEKEGKTQIPVSNEAQEQPCAHHWVRIDINGHKALKCAICGRVIDSQD